MRAHLRPTLVVTLVFLVLLGLAYPLAETGIAAAVFPRQAGGSLTADGSTRIGQSFKAPLWFSGRPDPFDPTATGGSNLATTSRKLEQTVARRIAEWHRLGVNPTEDLVTQSASGVDLDISPAGASAQVAMVAGARHLPVGEVYALVVAQVNGPELGFLGVSHVNVLGLNEALARLR